MSDEKRCPCGGRVLNVPGRVSASGPLTFSGGWACERCWPEAMPDGHEFEPVYAHIHLATPSYSAIITGIDP